MSLEDQRITTARRQSNIQLRNQTVATMQASARATEKEVDKVREAERKAARRKEDLEATLAAEVCFCLQQAGRAQPCPQTVYVVIKRKCHL